MKPRSRSLAALHLSTATQLSAGQAVAKTEACSQLMNRGGRQDAGAGWYEPVALNVLRSRMVTVTGCSSAVAAS